MCAMFDPHRNAGRRVVDWWRRFEHKARSLPMSFGALAIFGGIFGVAFAASV